MEDEYRKRRKEEERNLEKGLESKRNELGRLEKQIEEIQKGSKERGLMVGEALDLLGGDIRSKETD